MHLIYTDHIHNFREGVPLNECMSPHNKLNFNKLYSKYPYIVKQLEVDGHNKSEMYRACFVQ
jgi:hypothetical protein